MRNQAFALFLNHRESMRINKLDRHGGGPNVGSQDVAQYDYVGWRSQRDPSRARSGACGRHRGAPVLVPEPAVDGLNGKWEALGGSINRRSVYGSRGAVSIPLATQWGLQIDGAVGSLQSRAFGSIAPHLFWRNPSQGLIGLYASHTHWDQFGGVHVTQFAGEGEAYLGRFTVQGIAGVEFGNSVSNTTFGFAVIPPVGGLPGVNTVNALTQGYDIKTRFFDQINLKYYFTDNWAGYVGHRYLGGKNAFAVGAETAINLGRGVMGSLFVEARAGEHEFNGVWGGLKFYFGQKDKTLIQRHRQDDPPIWDTLHSILNNYNTSGSSTSTQFCPGGFPPSGGSCEIGS
jgi:hypothetical protein